MQILIVNFNLDGLSEEEFASSCDELAPAFAAVPGLASKIWLADRAEGIFGGGVAHRPTPRGMGHELRGWQQYRRRRDSQPPEEAERRCRPHRDRPRRRLSTQGGANARK